jgi:pimeloyl-ACP methyl ester carboxylesterase
MLRARRALLAVLVILAPVLVATTPAQATPGPTAGTLAWSDCSGGFQCATIGVPMDYHRPNGTQLSLAMIKLPATDQAHRIGTLFVNFGGPGASGVERLRARGSWDWLFSPQLKERFDIVSWDTRGVFHSNPGFRCFDTAAESDAFFNSQPSFPVGTAEEQKFYADNADLAQRCLAKNADLLGHMSTANTARDLDVMRQAVGDSKLTFLGLSYGTNVGATYANLFPTKVRAVVLDGTLDFIGNSTGHGSQGKNLPIDTRQDVSTGIADTFGQFLAKCDAGGTAHCAFAGYAAGDAAAKFATLTAAAKQHPITAGGQTWTYAGIIGTVTSNMYHPLWWADLAKLLQSIYDAATGAPTAQRTVAAVEQEQYDNLSEGYFGTNCADSVVPSDPAVYSRLGVSEDQRVPYFGPMGVFDYMACAFWPKLDPDRYTGPWNRWTSAPILVVNNRYDPATPLAGAQDATAELGRAKLFVVEGAGHTGMYVPSTCGEKVKRDYFISGTLPGPDVTCAADDNPFP